MTDGASPPVPAARVIDGRSARALAVLPLTSTAGATAAAATGEPRADGAPSSTVRVRSPRSMVSPSPRERVTAAGGTR